MENQTQQTVESPVTTNTEAAPAPKSESTVAVETFIASQVKNPEQATLPETKQEAALPEKNDETALPIKVEISESDKQRSSFYKLSEDEINDLSTKGHLSGFLDALDKRQFEKWSGEKSEDPGMQNPPENPAENQQAPTQQPVQLQTTAAVLEAIKAAIPVGDNGFSEEFRDIVTSKVAAPILAAVENQISQHSQVLNQVLSHLQAQQDEVLLSDLDKMFGDSKLKDVFGEGNTHGLDRNSPEFKNRAALINAMNVWEKGILSEGGEKPKMGELFNQMVSLKFSEHLKKIGAKELSDKSKVRSGMALPRPGTNQNTPAPASGSFDFKSWAEKNNFK